MQLQHVFQTTMKLTIPDQFDQLCQWMDYRQFATIDDLFDSFHKDPDKLDTKGPVTEYKWKGKMNHISPNVALKVKSFVGWMTHEERPSELHDDFLSTLTRERYLKFRDHQIKNQPLPTLPPSHHESQQHMTSFPSELKQPTQSESKIALNSFKKGTKRDASVYPIFKNDKYYDTFQRSFLANLKAQDLYDVADPDYDPESGDFYEHELFQGKQRRMLPLTPFFSDTPAINDGSTMAQFFVGRDTLVCDAYGIKSQKQFINTLYDNIRFRGAMTTLITDGGRYEIYKKVADLLRNLFIKNMNLNHITSIRTKLSNAMVLSRGTSTPS